MEYQVTEFVKDTIEHYYIKDKFIYVVYLDGHIVPYEYTEEKEKEILNKMMEQAYMLVAQKNKNIEYTSEYRRKSSNYSIRGYALSLPLLLSTACFGNAIHNKKDALVTTIYGAIVFISLYLALRSHIKAYKTDIKRIESDAKDRYIRNLEEFLEIMDTFKEVLDDPRVKALEPPLNINTFDEYNKYCNREKLADAYELLSGLDLLYYSDHLYRTLVEPFLIRMGLKKDTKKIEQMESVMKTDIVPAISTYDTLDDYHYEYTPKVLSKTLESPFKDLDN